MYLSQDTRGTEPDSISWCIPLPSIILGWPCTLHYETDADHPSLASNFSTAATLSSMVCALSVRVPMRISLWIRTTPFSCNTVCA